MTVLPPATLGGLVPVQYSRHRRPDPDEPVFAALATEWRAAGRMIPGERDREWVDLVLRRTTDRG